MGLPTPVAMSHAGRSLGDMQTIWKFPFAVTDEQTIDMPAEAEIIHVGLDPHGDPCLWAAIPRTDAGPEHRLIEVLGTGNPIPDRDGERVHLGSFTQGPFVWHIFEVA